ncbi:MAG TPA: c-type cytochrome [Thermoanaerobaculia bacterium]|nr:c-type cytochrome [Thermoanaerobaculia bacterium]
MKTLLKILGIAVLVVVCLAAIGVSWLALRHPASRPASSEKIEATPERIARGRYLAMHVSDCFGCHSDHLLTYGVPIKPGTEGQGGLVFDEKLGIPGVVCAQNITPDPENGLGNWSDGEILRAMREGVDRSGEALFPMMPYQSLREMSDDDARAIVAYVRTIKPVRHSVPPKRINFPVNLLVKFAPQPLTGPVTAPDDAKDHLGYGKYLAMIAGCHECHSPHDDKNQIVESKAFSGGWEMAGLWGRNVTSNLTPDPEAYLGRATKEEFIGRFRAFAGMNAENAPAADKGRNTVMPWLAMSAMTDQDLGAIYDYLKSLKPIKNKVVAFPDAAIAAIEKAK